MRRYTGCVAHGSFNDSGESVSGSSYPAELEHAVLLANGTTATIRPIRLDDREAYKEFFARLSPRTVYLRFFGPKARLSEAEITHFLDVDYLDRIALVTIVNGRIAGVARYDRIIGSNEAEVAFVVDDAHQDLGLGTLLLSHLAGVARERGIGCFIADVLADNFKMLNVFRSVGFDNSRSTDRDVVRVVMPIEPTQQSVAMAQERDRRAAARSIERILVPRSVVVIGAGRERGNIGHEIFRNLIQGGFNGPVYPVNASAPYVASVKAYESVLDIPGQVDLAVIVVPAPAVAEVIEQCAVKRVGGLVIISAGFAETGADGLREQRRIVRIAHSMGMRLVGPNCMGVINTNQDVSLNATFAPDAPFPGNIGFASQSGGLGIAILSEARIRGLGISNFVSMGNKADISGNDLLSYWEQDAGTHVALLYLESFGNPRTFSRLARRMSRTKPILVVKSGRTSAGQRGATSHTAAMATPEVMVQALFRHAGVIRVDTLEELFDVAGILVNQPLPGGPGVAIVGNSGGPGVLAADACEGYGLNVPELGRETQDTLRSFLPKEASVHNPVDLVASASADDFARALEVVMRDPAVDSVIVIFTPPLVTEADDVARAIREVVTRIQAERDVTGSGVIPVGGTAMESMEGMGADGGSAPRDSLTSKPVLANFLGTKGALEALRSGTRSIPWFTYPESAARALAKVVEYTQWLKRPVGGIPELAGIDEAGVASYIQSALPESGEATGGWLTGTDPVNILRLYGIDCVETMLVTSEDEAEAAASSIGFPVAVKVEAQGVVHKSDFGGVVLGLSSTGEVRRAYSDMEARFGEPMRGAVIQQLAPPGLELVMGIVQDPLFGSAVMFGLGGVTVEVLHDVAYSLVPLTDVDAAELVRSIAGAPLLFGYRGSLPVDVAGLEDMLIRLSKLADDHPEIAEVDLNPVIATADRCVAVDVRMRLLRAPDQEYEDVPRLRLK
ncbi:MAG: bifunctional acetate--CoA ligase family protein/GNAT family N-acetyltransferase [Acidimicrobiales bacterium]